MSYSIRTIVYSLGAVLLLVCTQGIGQSCEITLPSGTWRGETTKNVEVAKGNSSSISISNVTVNQYRILDLTAGLLESLGETEPIEVVISIDCNNQISSLTLETKYGTCSITGGQWNPADKKLVINWEIPFNGVYETSVFTLQ